MILHLPNKKKKNKINIVQKNQLKYNKQTDTH